MKKVSTLVVALLVSVATVVYVRHGEGGTTDRPTVERLPVSTGPVTQSVRSIGTLEPLRTVQIGSRASGMIKAIYADFNSIVKKDQVLAELDPSQLQEQVAIQEANLAKQDDDIAQQSLQLANDRENLLRARAEFASGLVSQQDLESAEMRVKTRAAQIESLGKMKEQAAAQLTQAKLEVSYCTIRSPIDGVVVNRLIDVGQTIQARVNAPQLFTLASRLSTLRLAAAVDEADIGYIRRGMPVAFTVDAYGNQTFSGRVEAVRLNAQVSNSVVTYPVWVGVPNPNLKLRPSMTAHLTIGVASAEQAIRVPNDALRFRPRMEMYAWLGLPSPPVGQTFRLETPRPVRVVQPAPKAMSGAAGQKIDDLFETVPKRVTDARVWVYDEDAPDPGARLRPIRVETGLSDGAWTEVLSGAVRPGMQLVTGISPPPSVLRRAAANPFQPRQRRRGGMVQMGPAPLPTLRRGR